MREEEGEERGRGEGEEVMREEEGEERERR